MYVDDFRLRGGTWVIPHHFHSHLSTYTMASILGSLWAIHQNPCKSCYRDYDMHMLDCISPQPTMHKLGRMTKKVGDVSPILREGMDRNTWSYSDGKSCLICAFSMDWSNYQEWLTSTRSGSTRCLGHSLGCRILEDQQAAAPCFRRTLWHWFWKESTIHLLWLAL